jgi:hypothetical protein
MNLYALQTTMKRNSYWDVILVAVMMSVAFLIVIMKLTDIWPCVILQTFDINNNACNESLLQNINSLREFIFKFFNFD